MHKKMLVIIGTIALLFLALFIVNQYKTKQAVDGGNNSYEKNDLNHSTIKQMDDPLYQNQITPNTLNQVLDKKESMTVYFYKPDCSYCLETTPILVPLAEELNIDLKKINLSEFKKGWDSYQIEGTPTLIHYENGKEVARIEGYNEESVFRDFFEEHVLKEK